MIVHFVGAAVVAVVASYLMASYADTRRPSLLGGAVFFGAAAAYGGPRTRHPAPTKVGGRAAIVHPLKKGGVCYVDSHACCGAGNRARCGDQ